MCLTRAQASGCVSLHRFTRHVFLLFFPSHSHWMVSHTAPSLGSISRLDLGFSDGWRYRDCTNTDINATTGAEGFTLLILVKYLPIPIVRAQMYVSADVTLQFNLFLHASETRDPSSKNMSIVVQITESRGETSK